MAKNDPLPKKYLDALNLISEGNLSFKQIAHTCNIGETTFYDLVEGNYTDGPLIQAKFTSALNDINKRRDKEIRDSIKSCKKKTYYLIDSFLANFKSVKKTDEKLISTLTSVANALAKSTPNVEIGSFSYTQGLSAEDIIHEFNRLTAAAFERRGLQRANQGGSGQIPDSTGQNRIAEEKSEDPLL